MSHGANNLINTLSKIDWHAFIGFIEDKKSHFWIILFLVICGCYFLSQLTWEVVEATITKQPAATIKQKNNAKKAAHDWFFLSRKSKVKTSAPVRTASKSINAKLHGIVAMDNGRGVALIAAKGKPAAAYAVGDMLLGNVIVSSIGHTQVGLDRDGTIYTLILPVNKANATIKKSTDNGSTKQLTSTSTATTSTAAISDNDAARSVSEIQEMLQVDPTKLMEKISITPKMVNGKIAGYMVTLMQDKTLFENIGLHTGDMLQSINGVDIQEVMFNQKKLRQLMQQPSIDLLLERQGITKTVTINLR
jgi:type II secretion system protein C